MTDQRPFRLKQTLDNASSGWLLAVILLIFTGCFTAKSHQDQTIAYATTNNTSVSDSLPDDSQTVALIQPYKKAMQQQMSEYIATIDSPFSNAFFVGNLGRLAADYMLLTANTLSIKEFGIPCHFAISNNGGFRTGFYPGQQRQHPKRQSLHIAKAECQAHRKCSGFTEPRLFATFR